MADDLFETINSHIIKKLEPDIIHGRKPDTTHPDNSTLITTIQNRTLIIDYHEDALQLTRTITELRIFRG